MFPNFTLPPGLAGFLADAREFLAGVRFAQSGALWLLLLLPGFVLVNRLAAARRRNATAAIGRAGAVAALQTHPIRRRRWVGLAYPLAWVLLVLGLAGPRWGKSEEPGVAVGRDLVLVVDLSRSMRAADMSSRDALTRWEAARAGLRRLMNELARRGGHRVALVVFAAKPKLVFPLTTDYDHARAQIEELDGRFPPPECRPGADPAVVSGTRIGAALLAAVDAHDPRFPGSQDILLVSDGDDPADDREWVRGSDAARKAGIPVHTVGVGDPLVSSDIPLDDGFVETPDKEPAKTRLKEAPLQQIAAETRGLYLPAGKEVPRLDDFFRTRIEPFATREVSDDAIPQPKERYAWFLAPAALLFAVGWLRGRH